MAARDYSIIVWGATGFTGQLVAEYLAKNYGTSQFRWAIAGRSRIQLETVKERLVSLQSTCSAVDVLTASIEDPESLDAMVRRTKVVISTVGPFLRYGMPLVDACMRCSTDYADITGETPFVRDVIDKYHTTAVANNVLLVPMSGFDSLPADLGALFVSSTIKKKYGVNTRWVKGMVTTNAGYSGGTAHTLLNMMDSGRLRNPPFSLNPNPTFRRATAFEADRKGWYYDADFRRWDFPFIMASANTRVVRRSAALLSDKPETGLTPDFAFNESHMASSRLVAVFATIVMVVVVLLVVFPPTRYVVRRLVKAPGQGPTAEERALSNFRYTFIGEAESPERQRVRATVSGGCPGYGETAKMLAETGITLALHRDKCMLQGGVVTPASAGGLFLMSRLNNAGIHFDLVD